MERSGFTFPDGAAIASGRPAIPVNEPHFGTHLAPFWATPDRHDKVTEDPAELTFNGIAGAASGTSYFLDESWRESWAPGLRETMLGRLDAQGQVARDEHGVRDPEFVIKDPNASHAAHAMAQLLPRARLIYLVRDGRDVVDSHVHAYGAGGWVAERTGAAWTSPEERLEFVRRISLLWARRMSSVSRAWELTDPALRRRLTYEELLADPATKLSELSEWMELDRPSGWVAEAVAAHDFGAIPESERGAYMIKRSASPGLWRENLTADEQAAAGEIMGPWLRRLGYAA